jgi:hypothetical protein
LREVKRRQNFIFKNNLDIFTIKDDPQGRDVASNETSFLAFIKDTGRMNDRLNNQLESERQNPKQFYQVDPSENNTTINAEIIAKEDSSPSFQFNAIADPKHKDLLEGDRFQQIRIKCGTF